MPLQDVILQSGVNSQLTLSLNTAGISISNLIRYKENLVQKLGGWNPYYNFPISTAPIRALQVFQALRGQNYLGVAALDKLAVISCGVLTDITPQAFTSSVAPGFSITSGSNVVTITDAGSGMSIYGAIRLDTPIAVGNLYLYGGYPIYQVVSSNIYAILASGVASTTISSGGTLPKLWCTAGSGQFDVELSNNNYLSVVGLYYPFRAPTTIGGQTIQGPYQVTKIFDSTHFQINSPLQASTTVSSATPTTMNSTLASIYHWVIAGPTAGKAYGAGAYGADAYGAGVASSGTPATPIVVTDWSLDNWGQNLIACQRNGPIFSWAPDFGTQQAQPIITGNAPLFNIGAFVAQPMQIMFAWGSCHQVTGQQDPLLIRWSDTGALQGYNQWNADTDNYAGSFRIPRGSNLMAAIQGPLYAVFLTDIEVWTATYIGQPLVYSFLRIASGNGCIGPHAVAMLGGTVFWASRANFYMLTGDGAQVMPCTVWDFFFQQLDTANQTKVTCTVNSSFNEIAWYFPVIGGSGENEAYVKAHIEGQEFQWDYGFLDRSAWTDITAIGMPVGAGTNGFVFQHETSPDGAGVPLNSAIETGYFTIGDSSEIAFVDWVLPDARFGTFGSIGATLTFTFYVTDYAGQAERVYGPFSVTESVPYINCRMRGRFWRTRIESTDMGSFWRCGRIKFRWAASGRR